MFELTILLSAFAAVFGMFHLNRLPRHHHPIFNSERFTGVLGRQVLRLGRVDRSRSGASRRRRKLLEGVPRDAHRARLRRRRGRRRPRRARTSAHDEGSALMKRVSQRFVLVARSRCARAAAAGRPRRRRPVVGIRNMYDQPRYDMQEESSFFTDHRTMRPLVEGVISQRGGDRSAHRAGSPRGRDRATCSTIPHEVVSARAAACKRSSSAARPATASTARPATTAPATATAS